MMCSLGVLLHMMLHAALIGVVNWNSDENSDGVEAI
jgi:hypothetical protein